MPDADQALVLLDTHIWVGVATGDQRLQVPSFLRSVSRWTSTSSMRVSVISVWEVAMLETKRRITFSVSCLEWVQRALRIPGMVLASLTPEIAVESSRLPGNFHGDPADRIIVATARSLGATLVTQDERILAYCRAHHLNAIAPSRTH
ncbi:MAG: type II toxin-antitoxin system VapC family toxin [Elusimicrobia bacterium]|nr:type II toxin-antitoxin system VapC family toxin [Elusimicrobiota bacterium]